MKRLSALGALVLTLVLAGSPAFALDFINDGASMFSASTVSDLNTRLSNFNAQTGKEVVVVTVPSLGGQTVKDAAEKEFAQRQVNGVLIYIAKDDRKDIFVPDSAGVRAGWFSPATLDPIRQSMES
ncbi:MAG TPA: TPM domain-containing protein, partial [Candidatus Baltobacteraceae bacterium]|nr:TPM domain-containing protein [Candidatus Baltobacteraceae bacterium]